MSKIICDLSSNNSLAQIKAAVAQTDGVIIKATEGKSYVNQSMAYTIGQAKSQNKLMGFYHYARPEKNPQPIDEVLHFIKNVYPYIGKCPMFLDWEGAALNCGQQWARDWLDYFYNITGVRPVIYVQESAVQKVGKAVADGNYGLWVAKYSKKKPQIAPWKVKLLWQYTSKPYDLSIMYGNENTWNAYAKRKEG